MDGTQSTACAANHEINVTREVNDGAKRERKGGKATQARERSSSRRSYGCLSFAASLSHSSK